MLSIGETKVFTKMCKASNVLKEHIVPCSPVNWHEKLVLPLWIPNVIYRAPMQYGSRNKAQ